MKKILEIMAMFLQLPVEQANALIALSAIFLAAFAIFVVWSGTA